MLSPSYRGAARWTLPDMPALTSLLSEMTEAATTLDELAAEYRSAIRQCRAATAFMIDEQSALVALIRLHGNAVLCAAVLRHSGGMAARLEAALAAPASMARH